MNAARNWTNNSVLRLAAGRDPIEVILEKARRLVIQALDEGWSGPPYDPIQLASILRINVHPREDVQDARVVSGSGGRFAIEFNPTKPRARQRFSVAHEIAHTMFPDCADRIRNRDREGDDSPDNWQLEMLCNIAAAELLMPHGSLPDFEQSSLGIGSLLELREKYEVSTEALLIRVMHVAKQPCAMFCASIPPEPKGGKRYRIDYSIPSRSWRYPLQSGTMLPNDTVLRECVAIGYTAKGIEAWPILNSRLKVECVGIPPYPGGTLPRVAGIVAYPKPQDVSGPAITYLVGDALDPRGTEQRVIAHVVNDSTPNWGGSGIAVQIKKKWPDAQSDFRDWVTQSGHRPKLGAIHATQINPEVWVASMVCQHGYGSSRGPRIRYEALVSACSQVAELAVATHATVHMPRIGTGQAGGDWNVIEDIILMYVCGKGVDVYVYDLPQKLKKPVRQLSVKF